jgi:hypothetical protein
MGGSSSYLANRDHEDVCPFSRGVMLQPLSARLQDGIRFFLVLVPALPWSFLTVGLPGVTGRKYGDAVFRVSNMRMG